MTINSIILSLFSLLIFILPIPGTLALRNVLAVSLMLILFIIFITNKNHKSLFRFKEFYKILKPLIVLTLFILFHCIFVSTETALSLSEFKSHWVYPMLYFVIGSLITFHIFKFSSFSKDVLINALFFTLLLHILYLDYFSTKFFLQEYTIKRSGGLLQSPASANYISNILASIISVEVLYRLRFKDRVLKVSNLFLYLIALIVLFSYLFEGVRFGYICLFIIGIEFIFFYYLYNRKITLKKKLLSILIFTLIFILPLGASIKFDDRWSSIIKTIPLAMETETNLYWQNSHNKDIVPRFESGQISSESNYLRLAWFFKGVEYIRLNPMGIGYSRNAFGRAIEMYEGNNEASGYHSHSSIIDFTIGIGIIGTLIWLFFIYRLINIAYKKASNDYDYYALLTTLLISIFFIRSIIDSNMRDHIFQNFMLILGITFSLMLYGKEHKNS
jgi:O-antigen ligase